MNWKLIAKLNHISSGVTCLKLCFAATKSLQSCPTLCDPIDGSPPGFPFPGILQARVLEWGAIDFSKNYVLCYHKLDICHSLFSISLN